MGARDRRTFKRCGCGAAYTLREWRALPRVAILDMEEELVASGLVAAGDVDRVPAFEMRDCPACGSTISVVVPYPGGSDYPPYLKGADMRYCRECKEAETPRENCAVCAQERAAIVAGLAREIFVRTVARRSARASLHVTYKDHALEAFVASDDFMGIAEQWADEGRDKVLSRRPARPAQGEKKKSGE